MSTTFEFFPDLASAGWYPDPTERSAERYYDGTRWTERVKWGDQETSDQLPDHTSEFLPKPHGSPISVETATQPLPTHTPQSVPRGPTPEVTKPKRRLRLIIAAALVAVIGVGIGVGVGAGGGGSAVSPQQAGAGYFNTTRLERSVRAAKSVQLADTSISVSSVSCIHSGGRHFACQIAFDDDTNLTWDILVSADGKHWLSTGGGH